MSYKLKYLKYKNKYVFLKQNIYGYSQNSNLSQDKLEQMNKNIIGGGDNDRESKGSIDFASKEEKDEYDLIKAGFTKEIAKTISNNKLMNIEMAIKLMNNYNINHRNSPQESPEIISNEVYNKLKGI